MFGAVPADRPSGATSVGSAVLASRGLME